MQFGGTTMNPIRKFFGKMFNFKKVEVVSTPKVEHFQIKAPQPVESVGKDNFFQKIFRRNRGKHPQGKGHIHRTGFGTFTRLRHIGGHPVRHLGRAFKDAFEKEYGVRLK
jgi:hypothetical protein